MLYHSYDDPYMNTDEKMNYNQQPDQMDYNQQPGQINSQFDDKKMNYGQMNSQFDDMTKDPKYQEILNKSQQSSNQQPNGYVRTAKDFWDKNNQKYSYFN